MAPRRHFRKSAPSPGTSHQGAAGAEAAPPLRVADAKLIENFLLATHDLPPSEVGGRIGEPAETIVGWRAGAARVASEELRMRILTFLALRSMEARCAADSASHDGARELHSSLPLA